MASKDIKVEGLRALENSLRELQREFGGTAATQALRPAVRAAMKPVEDTIRQDTPVETGRLKNSTKLSIGKASKKMVASDKYTKDTVIVGRAGWFWGRPSLWRQALAVEYGTRNQAAQAILRNIFDKEAGAMLSTFKNTLGPSIEKKAKQLYKKRMK